MFVKIRRPQARQGSPASYNTMVFDGLHWYWQPSSFAGCFIFALISLACWGSWSNTAKASAHIPFAVYYLDFSIGLFAVASLAFLSVGGLVFNDGKMDSSPQEPAGCSLKVFAAVGAGTLFNVANVLLVVGIQLAGLAVAFPVGIGLALVLGTLLTFLIDPHGNSPGPLFTGVALAFLAILCQVKAKLALDEDLRTEKTPTIVGSVREAARAPADDSTRLVEPQAASGMSKQQKALAVCVACGLLMSLWSPLSAYAMSTNSNGKDGYAGLWECSLTPYSTYLLFTAAALASSLLICKLLMERSGVGPG